MKNFWIIIFCVISINLFGQEEPSHERCPLTGYIEMLNDTITLGDSTQYLIHYPLSNGCATFAGVDVQTTADEVNHWLYQVCIPPTMACTEQMRYGFTAQKFVPKKRGEIAINIFIGEQKIGTQNLVVK